jgi:hypothetical protein
VNGYNYPAEYTILKVNPDKQYNKYFTYDTYYLPKVTF